MIIHDPNFCLKIGPDVFKDEQKHGIENFHTTLNFNKDEIGVIMSMYEMYLTH